MASRLWWHVCAGAALLALAPGSVAAQPAAASGRARSGAAPAARPSDPQDTTSAIAGEVGTVTRQVMRRGRPALLAGTLSAPSTEAAPAIGRAFLAGRPAVLAGVDASGLSLRQSAALPRGHMLRYGQEHAGLRVVGGDTVIRLDERGRVRWVSSDARPSAELAALAPDLARGPAMSGRDALEALGVGAGYDRALLDAVDAERAARLVLYPVQGAERASSLRLAYAVELPLDPSRMRKLRGYVDAETGLVYAVDDMVRRQAAPACPGFQDGYVYETNPVDSELACVSLADYLTPDSTALRNADLVVQNCVDRNGCREFGASSYHFCDFEATAAADQAGHYTSYVFESDTAEDDGFAEVQMFYHVNKAFGVARALGGFDDLDAQPLTAVVNFRMPSFDAVSECTSAPYSGDEALQAFDNALFVPADGLLPGFPDDDAIIFGQGEASDYAYDGDVVYHEFGHAVMARIAPDLPSIRIDALGLNTMPGGMHEGYADLMTMFVTDDPEIGEYAAKGFDPPITEIRNLANPATCPGWLTGEVHDDSLPFTGAIWAAREAVATTAEGKAGFDRAVFAAQRTLGELDDFGTAAQKTLVEIEAELGSAAAAEAEVIFAERGLLPDEARGLAACDNRVLDASNLEGAYMYTPGVEYFGDIDGVPAPLQFRYQLDERADSIEFIIGISVSDADFFGPGEELEPALSMLVHASEAPIQWSFAGGGLLGGSSQEAVDLTFEDVPGEPGLKRGTVSVKGPFDPGVYHLQLVNEGPSWIVADMAVAHEPYRPRDGGCQAAPGARGRSTGAALLFLFGAAAMFLRWRRSAGRMRRLKGRSERTI
jgi:hypothetical protein